MEDNGYQTPMEDTHAAFFAQEPHAARGVGTVTVGTNSRTVVSRPGLIHRGSHIVPIAPPNRQQSNDTAAGSNSRSLQDVMSKAEDTPAGQVSIKDRIACYRWTFFTMVCWFILRLPDFKD